MLVRQVRTHNYDFLLWLLGKISCHTDHIYDFRGNISGRQATNMGFADTLLRLAQSPYALYYRHNTLLSTHDLLVTSVSYWCSDFTVTQSRTYVCMLFDYACRLLGGRSAYIVLHVRNLRTYLQIRTTKEERFAVETHHSKIQHPEITRRR